MKSDAEYYHSLIQDEYSGDFNELSDIKITRDKSIFLRKNGHFIKTERFVFGDEFNEILTTLSGGLYAHEDTLIQGYFTDIFGNRCGVSGRAVKENGEVKKISDIDTVIIRLSPFYRHCADNLFELSNRGRKSILIYGPPSCGKTTLLRDLAFSLSDLPLSLHTVVIDTKCEFRASDYPDRCNITILRGYPFSKGMDIAIKSMSCDTVICDEIPIFEAADETINAAFCGVNIYASIHSSDRGFIKKSYYNRIYELGVFSEYYSVQREFKKSLVI